MRVIVSSANDWQNEQIVKEAMCLIPPGATVLLPSTKGACAVVQSCAEEYKIEVEVWSDLDYDTHGMQTNAKMFQTDIDLCIIFLSRGAYVSNDCLRRARNLDIDAETFGSV